MPNTPKFSPESVGGLLSQYGYIPETELRQLKNLQYKQGLLQAADRRQYDNFEHSGAAWIGGMIGAGLGGKLFKPALSSEERMRAEELRQMNEELNYINNWRSQAGLPPLSAEEQDFALGDIAAKRLAAAGDYNKAAVIGMKNAQNRAMFKQKQLEQNKLVQDEKTGKANERRADAEARRIEEKLGQNPIKTIWRAGSTDPNSGIDAFINPDTGAAEVRDPATGEVKQTFPAGTYTTNEPNRPPQPKGGSGKADKNPQGRTPTENAGVRTAVASTIGTFQVQLKLADILSEVAQEGSINIMGGAGEGLKRLENGVNMINSMVRGLSSIKGENGKDAVNRSGRLELDGFTGSIDGSASSIEKFAKANRSRLRGLIPVPEGLSVASSDYQRFQAMVIQLAYLRARSFDPTARQLSDNDFQVALKSTGGAASNPEAFRQILINDMDRQMATINTIRQQFLSDEDFNTVAGPRAVEEMEKLYTDAKKRYSLDFGTNENPGPGLTDYANGQRKPNLPSPEETEAARKAVNDTVLNLDPL